MRDKKSPAKFLARFNYAVELKGIFEQMYLIIRIYSSVYSNVILLMYL